MIAFHIFSVMSDYDAPRGPCENSNAFSLYIFDVSHPRVWFMQVEVIFRFRKITSQQSMLSYVTAHLQSQVASEVIDILDPMPTESPYD